MARGMTLPILFEDAEALVIDKPAGLAVSRPRAGGRSLEDHLPALALGFRTLPMPAHRLDRDTSGCLLLARTPRALRRLSAAFEARTVAKTYLAILDGQVSDDDGTIDLPLAKVSTREAGWRIVGDATGRPASTRWWRLGRAGGRTLVRLAPATGRTHQLRVHAREGLGAPIAGDPVYGMADPAGMMLHAWRLEAARVGKPPIVATAPWPDRFTALGFTADICG